MLVGIPKMLAMLTFHIAHQQLPLSTDVEIGEWVIWPFFVILFLIYFYSLYFTWYCLQNQIEG